jgi:hypothetical protein
MDRIVGEEREVGYEHKQHIPHDEHMHTTPDTIANISLRRAPVR